MRLRIRRRSIGLQVTILCLTAIVALARYWYNVGFDQKYRQLIADELARYGLGADIGRLTLDPVEGLTARDVKLFDLATPGDPLAGINRITLDIDVARLVNREDFLRSITLTKAHLSLPVDPADATSEWIRVKDLNARLIIKGRQIEIAHAEANLSGLHVTVRGEVTRGAEEPPADPEEERRKREQQLREMRDRRGALRSVLRVLDRFSIPAGADGVPQAPHIARVEVDVNGDLADLDKARVRATMRGGPLRCGEFQAAEYSADVVLEDGELTLRRLNVLDDAGSFSASAAWKIRQSAAVDIAVDSSIDLLALLRGTIPDLQLPDGLDVAASPHFRANGVLHADRPFTWSRLPVDLTGSLTAGAFTVKGERYESLHGDFAIRENGFLYLRNVKVVHGSGSLSGQFMRQHDEVQYEFVLDAGMTALAPLLDLPEVRKPLAPVTWSAESHVSATFSGTGAADGQSWSHRGTIDARNYRLRGEPVRQFDGTVEVGPGAPPVITIRDFLLRREDGDITGASAVIDQGAQLLHLKGVTSTCMPSPAAGMFAPKTGEWLARYFFESPPRTELDGVIGLRSPRDNDLRVRLHSPAVCGLPVGKDNPRFTGVTGSLHLKKDIVAVDLAGKSAPRQTFAGVVRFDSPAAMQITGDFSTKKESSSGKTRYTVVAEAPESARLLLADREFPIEQLDATVRAESGRLTVNAGGRLFGGRVGSLLEFPDAAAAGHRGSVAVDAVGFSELTTLFGTSDETGGALSGRFAWQTPDGRGTTFEGSGTATLEEGNIFAVPLLGPLSTIISALLPGDRIAYSVARKATASFRVANGRVTTSDFEAATRTFRLTASGVVDVARNYVDLSARVNLRGAPGLLLYPVSKLFEYHAGGTMANPGWRPKHLPAPFRRDRADDRSD